MLTHLLAAPPSWPAALPPPGVCLIAVWLPLALAWAASVLSPPRRYARPDTSTK